MTETRTDPVTGETLYPPSGHRRYWHTLPPTGGGPLVAHDRDDPYLEAKPPKQPND